MDFFVFLVYSSLKNRTRIMFMPERRVRKKDGRMDDGGK
jgi:hypothetical protein